RRDRRRRPRAGSVLGCALGAAQGFGRARRAAQERRDRGSARPALGTRNGGARGAGGRPRGRVGRRDSKGRARGGGSGRTSLRVDQKGRREMKALKLDHVGIAVESLDEALELYSGLLGLELKGIETVEEQKVRTAFLPLGNTELELLESTDPEGPIAKFIAARGPGLQHIAFRVDDIDSALEELKAAGLRLIDEKPRYGAGGVRIAFLHPKSAKGVLV